MKVLVTGGSGFAGRHLVAACLANGDEVWALSRGGASVQGAHALGVDLCHADATRAAVASIGPDVVHHLAGWASVGASWSSPLATLHGNLDPALNVLEAVRLEAPAARVIAVASGEVYGRPESLPMQESMPLRPQNPYAVSKVAAEAVATFYADAYGLHVVRARAFNHAGPGQESMYVVSSLTRQAAAALVAGESSVRIVTGNADTRRDFTDVRDVVRAYRLLAEHADAGVFNVCSGATSSAGEIIEELRRTSGLEIEHVVDPKLIRENEVMEIRGDRSRVTEATGWEPVVSFEQTVGDTLAWWREELSAAV